MEIYKSNDKCPFAEKCYAKGGHYTGGTWCTTPPYRKCDMWKVYVKEMKDQELIIDGG
ncbi:MAG: hypothetical protein GY834_02320 [Bacteroidetes bacterium]|nr:hypothetical protein [Bacteroidota bacterium]